MVLKAEDILREIESAGYQVTGGRESIGDGLHRRRRQPPCLRFFENLCPGALL